MEREAFNKAQRVARADCKAKGICVDCRLQPVKPDEPGKPPHVCCEGCLAARRSRQAPKPPLRWFPTGGRFL